LTEHADRPSTGPSVRMSDKLSMMAAMRSQDAAPHTQRLCAYCPRPSFSSQSATCCIEAAPRIVGLHRPAAAGRVYPRLRHSSNCCCDQPSSGFPRAGHLGDEQGEDGGAPRAEENAAASAEPDDRGRGCRRNDSVWLRCPGGGPGGGRRSGGTLISDTIACLDTQRR
jgi:hypothetical protein